MGEQQLAGVMQVVLVSASHKKLSAFEYVVQFSAATRISYGAKSCESKQSFLRSKIVENGNNFQIFLCLLVTANSCFFSTVFS